MAMTKNLSKEGKVSEAPKQERSAAEMNEAVVSNVESRPVRMTAKEKKDREEREKLIKDNLHPDSVKYLKEHFGLDIMSEKFPISAVYDIIRGNVTKPLDAYVHPMAYSKESEETVTLAPLPVKASFKFNFPHEKVNGKYIPVGIDEKHPVYVRTFPAMPYLEKIDGNAVVKAAEESAKIATSEDKAVSDKVRFNDDELFALEGIGVNYENLYYRMSDDQRKAIQNGEPFNYTGTVRTEAGYINVSGRARLEEGRITGYMPLEPRKAKENEVIDILFARKTGKLELDVFKRDSYNNILKDGNGMPILNDAAKNLISYGSSLGPMKGYVSSRVWDKTSKMFKRTVESGYYQVAVVNGGLMATEMKKVIDLDVNGNPIKIKNPSGKSYDKYHYEVAGAMVGKNGHVWLDGKELEFKTDEDRMNYLKGVGGVVSGAVWKEYGKDGKVNEVTHDALVIPDIRKNGNAKQFSPELTENILKARNFLDHSESRKQNFSIGW